MPLSKIALLSSGGDCGGLNAFIKGAAKAAHNSSIDCYLIPNGYAGLYNLRRFSALPLLDEKRITHNTFPIYLAGSEAGNSRVKISKIQNKDKYKQIQEGLAKFQIDALMIAGGDDTGSVVVELMEQGIRCVHIPKTMDLDLAPYSVGADSTINRIAAFARDLRTTGQTHNRIMVMEVFGRYAGHTAFRGGIGAEADIILIPEVQVDFDVVYKRASSLLKERIQKSDNHAGMVLIVVAEGLKDASGSQIVDKNAAPDAFGHYPLIGAGKYVAREIEARLKKDPSIKTFMQDTKQYVAGLHEIPEVREIRPSHLVRCGTSSALDISFGMEAGAGALALLEEEIFGVTVVSYRAAKLTYMDCKEAIQQRYVDMADIALYESLGICFGREVLAGAQSNKQARLKKIEKNNSPPMRPY